MLFLAAGFLWLAVMARAAAVPVAIFPLQELGDSRNDVNLPFTILLTEHLMDSGSTVIDLQTVIDFMANNRIRTVGHLDLLNISRVRQELGAAFVLLGTVTQQKEKPEPSMGLTLNLVRTSDFRVIWTHVGSLSLGDERSVLGIGEPATTQDLQFLLMDDIVKRWPWQTINEEQLAGSLNIDSTVLEPDYARPGDEIRSRVRLRNTWPVGQAPRVFFKADDQLYPATVSADGKTYEGAWVAGEENGRFQVILLIEWPLYGRTETALLGNYFVDATPPLFEINLRGTQLLDGQEVFNRRLYIIPQMIVRKPLAKWRLSFYYLGDTMVGEMEGTGNLPGSFIWSGRGSAGDGTYSVELEVWDLAGNTAKSTKKVIMNRSLPEVDLDLDWEKDKIFVDLENEGKVPLRYWRLEMWTNEGRILTQAEGRELPVKIGIELPESLPDQEVKGFLFTRDVLGTQVTRKVEDLLPRLTKKPPAKEKESTGISEKWVDEF